MGCTSSREKIEDEIMKLKLVRMEIQMERENHINKLSEMDGKKIIYNNVPDYIDPDFAKEKNILFGTSPDIIKQLSNETIKNEKDRSEIKNTNNTNNIKKNKNKKRLKSNV